MNDLYNRIHELCQTKGVSIGKMCNEIGISRGNLTELKMERIKTLKIDNLTKISDYFNVSVDYLLGKEAKKASTPKDERKRKLHSIARLESADITPELDKNIADYIDFLLKKREEPE